MRKLIGLLGNRWLLSCLGLGAVASVIWMIGPLIGFGSARPLQSPSVRLIVILVMVVFWALNHMRKVIKANQANQGMVDGLVEAESAGEDPDRSAEEIATLKERFEEAVEVLKKSKGKKSRLSLYDLPWYIIIGPPGSGKTTALVNSGLEFPLAERYGKEALSGVGGTRNCDWWFTDEAILLDTAGRYTTQDSDADVDRSAWEGFLNLLKKYRRRRPINGVLVAISLSDLMVLNEHERISHARAIKSRIQELDQHFGIRFPVYVMLTKCDLVAGFMEFFDDLGRSEREQVWGVTFPIEASESAEGVVDRFGPELDGLLERLSDRLLWRMSQERDPRRRAAIYGFPRQLASLKQSVEGFLGDVFRGSRFEQAPMLRGIYFTSGTQEGTPIDRLMGAVARTFGLDQQAVAAQGGQGRSYFIKSLLTDVVFQESEIAGTNRRVERQRAWLQKAAYAGSVLLAVLFVLGWTVSYFNNRAFVGEARAATETAVQAVEQVAGNDLDVRTILPALDAARGIPGGYGDRDAGAPLLAGLGLYQGGKLGDQASAAYRRVLTQVLLPRLILRMEGQLRSGGPSPDFQYEALKAYLMLDSRDHYDPAEVIAWLQYDLATNLPRQVSTAEREAIFGHLEALFEEQPVPLPLPLDQTLIEQTQRVVARMPTEERIYSRLKRRGAGEGLREFSLFDAAGPRSQIVFSRRSNIGLNEGIDGLFTRDGYQRVFVAESVLLAGELIDESWILGDYAPPAMESTQLVTRVKNLYLDEFSRQYENLLLDIQLAPFSTAEEASSILNILSDPVNSPLLLLLAAVAEETQLESSAEAAAASVGNQVREAGDRLTQLFGGGPAQPTADTGPANVVEEQFRWLQDLMGEDPASAPIQNVLALLDELYRFMAVIVAQGGLQGDIPANVASQGQLVIQQLRTEATRQPAVIETLLTTAAARSQGLAFSGVMAYINSEWQSEGLRFCRQAITGRYPVARDATQEIRLDDFGTFFAPGGLVDAFFRDYLADYVDMSRSPWRVRASGAIPVQISAAALQQFERANAIMDTFFRAGGTLPSVTFELRPVGMDASISQFNLELEGQRITYSHGPVVTEFMTWPGPEQNAEVRIEMTPASGASMVRDRGPWAWFRVLDRANITAADQAEVFEVEFTLDGRTALYELIARSAYNPFRFPELEQFSCPETL